MVIRTRSVNRTGGCSLIRPQSPYSAPLGAQAAYLGAVHGDSGSANPLSLRQGVPQTGPDCRLILLDLENMQHYGRWVVVTGCRRRVICGTYVRRMQQKGDFVARTPLRRPVERQPKYPLSFGPWS